eukprot:720817-Prymnesium_polylepis.1
MAPACTVSHAGAAAYTLRCPEPALYAGTWPRTQRAHHRRRVSACVAAGGVVFREPFHLSSSFKFRTGSALLQ